MDLLKAIEREGLLSVKANTVAKSERPEWYVKAVKRMEEGKPKCTKSEDYVRLGAEIVLILLEDDAPVMRTVLQAIKATFDTLPRKEVVSKRTGRTVNVIDGVYARGNFRSTAEGVDYRGVYGVASILLHNYKLAEALRSEYRKLLAGSMAIPSTVSPAEKAMLKRLVK